MLEIIQPAVQYVSPTSAKKLAEGKVFATGGTVDSTVAVTGDFVLINPPTSTRVLYVLSWTLGFSMAGQVTYVKNPTRTGGTARPITNLNFASANTSLMEVFIGQGILSGGTDLGPRHRVNTQLNLEKEVLVPIPPNQSIGIQFPNGVDAVASIAIQWYEE